MNSLVTFSAVLAVCLSLIQPIASTPQRLILARILFDGKPILEATTSDDGYPDADAVWEYLKSVKFKPTDEFKKLKIDAAAKEALLSKKDNNGDQHEITVEIRYGGEATPDKLRLIRVPSDKRGREWILDPLDIDSEFNLRTISRRLASKLNKPQAIKPWKSRKK
jgi:hypothetical protein